ncbi:hypothetical protein GCM10025783_00470 [Amnibacterium soli]|uniref:Methyltransferase type 11 domain-containing protein n=1 Tax=Amnibacterium soli TaxID=1282736 RepID=A0ABP8YQR4_9MICO
MVDWSGAEAYAASYARLCGGAVAPLLDLVERSGPRGGVLADVGTGPGTLAAAAEARGWSVEAIEPEPAMRRLAEQRLGRRVRAGALPDLPLADAAVDVAAAGFVVNHLPDPRAGVRGLARVVRPGGAVAVSIWPGGPNALTPLWEHVVAASGAVQPGGLRLDPALDFDRTEAGLAALLREAGLGEVVAATARFDCTVAPDPLWRSVEAGIGVIGTTWRQQAPRVRAAMHDAYRAETARLAVDGVLRFPAIALLAIGRRSGGAHAAPIPGA